MSIFFSSSQDLSLPVEIYPEAAEGQFSFKQFYKRRINRIVPALIAVLAATGMLGIILLSPADLVRLAKCTVASVLSVSNIFLWREYGNYFFANAAEAPLLHTWSLGVEEQFYLVWPVITVGLARLRPKHAAILLAAMACAGLIASEFALNRVASSSYYLLPTRFFELMIGGLLVLPVFERPLPNIYVSHLCRLLGYSLIACSLFYLDSSSPFPGINALLPCCGAAFIIFAGKIPLAASRLLTARPMVFIGLISYSLYLWHWPIIAYLNYLNIEIGAATASAALAAAFLFAWASWKYIETPLRRGGNSLAFSAVFAEAVRIAFYDYDCTQRGSNPYARLTPAFRCPGFAARTGGSDETGRDPPPMPRSYRALSDSAGFKMQARHRKTGAGWAHDWELFRQPLYRTD